VRGREGERERGIGRERRGRENVYLKKVATVGK